MGAVLVYDIESSGLLRDHLPNDDPNQPSICSIAAQLYDEDSTPIDGAEMNRVIKPDGWGIEPGATAIHGITDAFAHRYGARLSTTLPYFMDLVIPATLIVGHGIHGLDERLIDIELQRLGAAAKWWTAKKGVMRCTKELATDIVKLPGQFGQYKWPSLDEAFAYFFPGEKRAVSHRAKQDVIDTARIWFAMQEHLHV